MEFNSIYVHDPESTYVRGAVERIFFLTLRDEGGSRSVVVFKFPGGGKRCTATVERICQRATESTRCKFFQIQSERLATSLPVFVSSASTPTIHSATGLGFTPTPSSRTDCVRTRERDTETLTAIKNLDPELGAFVAARIRRDFGFLKTVHEGFLWYVLAQSEMNSRLPLRRTSVAFTLSFVAQPFGPDDQ